MLTDPRKLFSITTVYDAGFIFPGSTLPGPEAPRLTEPKQFNGVTYNAGDFDPEWRRPDIENIYLGEYDGRFYYSIREDVVADPAALGTYDVEAVDPQIHTTVSRELANQIAKSSYLADVYNAEGMPVGGVSSFDRLFPTSEALQSALLKNPEVVQKAIAASQTTADEVLVKLGVVVAE